MKDILCSEFKRKFSVSMYKNLKLKLAEMSFYKNFLMSNRGDLYPILHSGDDCKEKIEYNRYTVIGEIKRFICQFFPYATYEISADIRSGEVGFSFILTDTEATVSVSGSSLIYRHADRTESITLPNYLQSSITFQVSCRPGAFDVYFLTNEKYEFFTSISDDSFLSSNEYSKFSDGISALYVNGDVTVSSVQSFIDNGISIADMRSIRYENGDVMIDHGKVYFTASIRMQVLKFQGVFSWVPGTAEFELVGTILYDSGDGKWCGDVAASIIYNRACEKWYLWVCSFSHNHILGHSEFDGDPRFGVNVIDLTLMDKAPDGAEISDFVGFEGDEDPDFIYDEERGKWLMSVCRLDKESKNYRYVFFESDRPFDGYQCIGQGYDGAETGGSFVKVNGELVFICGNDFHAVSDYRIYRKGGMTKAKFNFPDGGFRGWGTLMPIKAGSRTRYFWLTFDRQLGSSFNWSYGNLYCFEA